MESNIENYSCEYKKVIDIIYTIFGIITAFEIFVGLSIILGVSCFDFSQYGHIVSATLSALAGASIITVIAWIIFIIDHLYQKWVRIDGEINISRAIIFVSIIIIDTVPCFWIGRFVIPEESNILFLFACGFGILTTITIIVIAFWWCLKYLFSKKDYNEVLIDTP
jgi:hypothetical protein